MLILKGNKGKMSVCSKIVSKEQDNCIVICYNDKAPALKGSYTLCNGDINEFLENIQKEAFYGKEIVIIYTNEKESDINPIKEYLTELEDKNYIGIGIVACKED